MMKQIINEWKDFLKEGKAEEVQNIKNIINSYKNTFIHGANLGKFLEKLAVFESNFNSKAVNGPYKGVFQLSADIANGSDPFKPKEAAKAVFDFFNTKLEGLFKENPDLESLVKKNPMLFLFLVHNQGKYGAVRILYTINDLEDKLVNKIDTKIKGKSTIDNIDAQKISAIKGTEEMLDAGRFYNIDVNKRKAILFVEYLKSRFKL